MRLDHIAYRVNNRYRSAGFFTEAFGYTLGTEFQIEFDDGSKADCIALGIQIPDFGPIFLYKLGPMSPLSLSTMLHQKFLLATEQKARL